MNNLGSLCAILLSGFIAGCQNDPTPLAKVRTAPAVNPDAVSPWKSVQKRTVATGVTFEVATGSDNSSLNLLTFDFQANPHLRFGIYDQDQDDERPFDNQSDYFPNGVGHIIQKLSAKKDVVAAWNGLFFGYDRGPGSPPNGWATHIGPVVLDGKVYHNVGRHRWTFGVKDGKFKALFKPSKEQLPQEFEFAADGAQLLIKDGEPLKIQGFEESVSGIHVEDTIKDAGSIPVVDWMKTSRTSLAWSRDGRFLWVLIVVENGHETESKLATKYGKEDTSGWNLIDLQEYWKKQGVWYAVNSDGGVVTQFGVKAEVGFEVVGAQQSNRPGRRSLKDLEQSSNGGSLQTFYIWTSPARRIFTVK